jgi:hypothetical protein
MLANQNPNQIITASGAPAMEHSELQKISQDVLDRVKATVVAVASQPEQTVKPGSLEAAVQEGLIGLKPAQRERVCRQAGQIAHACASVRQMHLGRYGQLSCTDMLHHGFEEAAKSLPPLALNTKLLGVKPRRVTAPVSAFQTSPAGLLIPAAQIPPGFRGFQTEWEEALNRANETGLANPERLAEIWGMVARPETEAAQTEVADIQAVAMRVLHFVITRIKCVDETQPEWPGHDEIALAGISVDESGDTKKIGEIYIGGGFDDGDQKVYQPGWRYHSFSLAEGKGWPKVYLMNLLLAEKDHGGLAKILDKAWDAIGAKVKEEIRKAVAHLLPSQIDPAIAAAIGQAAAWIADQLVKWLINLFKDDLFPLYTARVTLSSANGRWNYPNGQWGSPVSPLQQAHFYGHGGHYLLEYRWELTA